MPEQGIVRRQGKPYDRELRRLRLAFRMIALSARTRTICIWTGLSEARVQQAARLYWSAHGTTVRDRPSGPSPTALKVFWQSQRLRLEAVAIAGLCALLDVVPPTSVPMDLRMLPNLQRGERLCLAYETYLSFVPQPQLSLEQTILLVSALARGKEVALGRCIACSGPLLIDCLDGSRPRCVSCKARLRITSEASGH